MNGGKNFKYFCFILISNLALLLILEGLARIFITSPLQMFRESKDSQGRVWVHFFRGSLRPSFLKKKPAGTYRVFAMGESTVMGFPYHQKSSFPRMIEYALQKSAGSKKLEVINLALSGMNSLDQKHIIPQALRYSPDLVILYCGQNELYIASLVQDWQHPNLDRFLNFFRRHCRIYQALMIFGPAAIMLPAAIGVNQELANKFGIDFDEAEVENTPMTATYYNDRMQAYRYHMARILERLQREKVPVVLCTVVVNFEGWAPEWLPYPENLKPAQWEALKQSLHDADLALADNRMDQVESILDRIEPVCQNYALYHFVRAWFLEKQGKTGPAREHFLLAHQLDSSRHRAPPEINLIIRELASQYHAQLADLEQLFFENSPTAPGFDLLVDHVHPNLTGQRLIAQQLQPMVAQGMGVKVNPAEFPSLAEFERAFQMDPEYLADIDLRLAIYYLMRHRLPEGDRHTIELLNRVIELEPGQIIARVLLASVYLGEDREAQAEQIVLSTFRASRNADQAQRTLMSYLFPKILMQGNYLLFHLNLDPAVALLHGILLVRPKPEQTQTLPGVDLGRYQWIFRSDPARDEIENVTASVHKICQTRQAFCKKKDLKPYALNDYYRLRGKDFSTNDSALSYSRGKMVLEMTGNDPWFFVPLALDPVTVDGLALEIAVHPYDPKQNFTLLDWYWTGSQNPEFSEAQKVSLPLKADGKFHSFFINLGGNMNWRGSGKVNFFRLDPAGFPGRAVIKKFEFIACEPAP